VVQDSSTPQLQQIVTVTCPRHRLRLRLVVTPTGYTYVGRGAAPQRYRTVVTGGTAPYTMVYSGRLFLPATAVAKRHPVHGYGIGAGASRIEPFTVRDAAGAAQHLER
jgi:hypothetical protein